MSSFYCVFFLRLGFFCALLPFRFIVFFFLRFHEYECRSKRITCSSLSCFMTLLFIKNKKNIGCILISRGSLSILYIKKLFIICRLVYSAQCRCVRLPFCFYASSLFWFFVFSFLRLLFFFASSFSEKCVFVL